MRLVNKTIVFSQEELDLLKRLNPTMLDLAKAFPEVLTISPYLKERPEDAVVIWRSTGGGSVCPEEAFYIPGNSEAETYGCAFCSCSNDMRFQELFPCWLRRWNDVVATFNKKKFIVDGQEVDKCNDSKD